MWRVVLCCCDGGSQLDAETLGTLFYDLDAEQQGGPGVYFVRTPI
eukprot:COSAG06_NODE_44163_length_365_cov_2.488722_1_plen_44_part_10